MEHAPEEGVDGVWSPVQPGPYFAIRTPHVLIVCIDTGITGKLDTAQGEWLEYVSRMKRESSSEPLPKVLITGKPIYVDGKYKPGEIDWAPEAEHKPTVDEIVRDPDHGYVAAIGGDVHNYQHYRLAFESDGGSEEEPSARATRAPIHYFVSGGGGAYLSATHRFKRVDLNTATEPRFPKETEPLTEENSWVYPLRGDSLARLTRSFAPMMGTALLIAIAVFGLGACAYFIWPGEGFDHRIGNDELAFQDRHVVVEDDMAALTRRKTIPAWQNLIVVPATLGLVALIAWASARFSRFAAPNYRTLTATIFAVMLGATAVLLCNELMNDRLWDRTWKMALIAIVAIVLPLGGSIAYYLLRDFIPPSVRLAVVLAIPVGLIDVYLAQEIGRKFDGEAAALVAGSLLVIWLGVVAFGQLRRASPEVSNMRVQFARLAPPLLALIAICVAVVELRREVWLLAGVPWALWVVAMVLAFVVLLLGWRGLRAALWLRGNIDPDYAARWVADRLEVEPVREHAKEIELRWLNWESLKTKALASLTYKSWPFTLFMSELAEASKPPFFKNFMRVDVGERELTLTTFGVTGWREDEDAPKVEDRVSIPLPAAAHGSESESET
jgi:hypothetical protein